MRIHLKTKKKILIAIGILILVLSCVFFWRRQIVKSQEKAIAWVEANGGTVSFASYEWVNGYSPFIKKFLESVVGENVSDVFLMEGGITEISPLERFSELKNLVLNNAEIESISSLKELEDLELLDISFTSV